MTVKVFIPGEPVAQPRPRAAVIGGKARVYNPDTAKEWKECIKVALRRHWGVKLDGPLELEVAYLMKRPQSLMRNKDPESYFPHGNKPDIDNLNKALLDAISNCEVWGDDRQVYSIKAAKYFVAKGGRTGAKLLIRQREESCV